ncbi:MAG: electron transport complex subunit RsxC [Motiliproteus sp.]
MSRIWSFHGGIHPAENKRQSLQRPLERPPLPKQLILPLQQHIGAPATPLVEVGDKVLKGQAIAEPTGHVSIYQHAPTSGTISAIGCNPIPHPSGMEGLCVTLEPDGLDQWIDHQGVTDFRSLEKAELARIIRHAGISGMGGAGFPTEIKLHLSDDRIVNTLIINGAECEPYITADDLLMRERAESIIGGIEIAAHLIKPTHCLIGIEDNKPEAAMALTRAARAACNQRPELDIEVVVIPTKYPSGGEKQLVKLLTGIEVPAGRIPADIGIVVQNVSTMSAVERAVCHGEPLISRITTLTGEALARPGNLEVLLGTPIQHLLDHCGAEQPIHRLVMGGPMMGYTLTDSLIPVIKTSNCIIAATAQEFGEQPAAQNCIRCGQCEQVCPAELLPQQLHWFAKGKEFEKALAHNLMDCIECGACSYVCPSNIPLVQYYRFAKGEIRREQFDQRNAEQARIRFEAREARLEQEKRDKATKRKARAEAAARAKAEQSDKIASTTSSPVSRSTSSATTNNTADSTASDPQALIKTLKTAAAVARTKLKKAEKALAQARDDGNELAPFETTVSEASAKVEASQQALQQAEQQNPAPAPSLAELKIAAATARTKLTKTEKALADAEAKQAPSADKLRVSLEMLRSKAEAAQSALEQAAANTPPAPVAVTLVDNAPVDIKALKTAASISRTKLKKAQKALDQAQADGSADLAELEAQLAQLSQQAEQAKQAFEEAEAQQPVSTSGPDLKALKSAAAIARTKVNKTEKALADADAKQSPSADKLRSSLETLKQKAELAQQQLDQAEQSTSQAPPSEQSNTQQHNSQQPSSEKPNSETVG